jgi:HAMP domain-containing protein
MSKFALFFSRLDAFDPAAVGIAALALIVMFGAAYVLSFWHENRQIRRESERRNGYRHRLRRVEPPAPLRAVPTWPPVTHRDAWAPSSQEHNGRAGTALGFQDEVARNAERHRRSLS